MKKLIYLFSICLLLLISCGKEQTKTTSKADEKVKKENAPIADDVSDKDVVKIAAGSKDHTTLVTALQAADLVTSLGNAGPFTVFAPVNAAFDKLPPGTVEELLKPENKDKLATILQHHVYVGVYKTEMFQDGMTLGMVDGKNAKITKKGDDIFIDKAKIIATVPASNGIVYVVDEVILPE